MSISRRLEKEAGFTLVELLVVILIIGILAAVAIPAFLAQRQRANDASVESDVRNIAMLVHDAEIDCPDAAGYYIRPMTGDVLPQFSWTKSDGTTIGPIAANSHTVSADYLKNRPAKIELRTTPNYSDICASQENFSLSDGTIIHLTYVGSTNGTGIKNGEFVLYGWHPNGAEYNGDTLSFTANKGEFTPQEEASVYVYRSVGGGASGN